VTSSTGEICEKTHFCDGGLFDQLYGAGAR
jgi:hypothetical protein